MDLRELPFGFLDSERMIGHHASMLWLYGMVLVTLSFVAAVFTMIAVSICRSRRGE